MKQTVALIAIFLSITAFAQHDHMGMHPAKDSVKQSKSVPLQKDTVPPSKPHAMHMNMKDTIPQNQKVYQNPQKAEHDHDDDMNMSGHSGHVAMSHSFSLNLPMTRNGSGTSWLPDNSPMYAYMFHSKSGWMYMLHGDVYLRYNKQDVFEKGSRGGGKFDAPNMVMLMGQHGVGKKGLFHFNSMFSLDPLTVGEEGYPLLFQTGESYKGQPLVDRQHPHDLFSELSVSYAQALSKKADVFLYVGYPGEPALGPAAYVHRFPTIG